MAADFYAHPDDVDFVHLVATSAGQKYQRGDVAGAVRELRAGANESTHPKLRKILDNLADEAGS